MTSQDSIRIAAALMSRSDGRVLLVRKRATESFMQPGGKIDRGEHPQAGTTWADYSRLALDLFRRGAMASSGLAAGTNRWWWDKHETALTLAPVLGQRRVVGGMEPVAPRQARHLG